MSTKSMTFSVDYDLEVERNVKCTAELEARDEHNLQGSNRATVHITVNDVNDNACSMPTLTLQPNWNGLTLPVRLANLFATDNDFTDPNNKLTYQLVSSQPSEASSYFSVATPGEIYYIDKIPESNSGKGFTLFIKCMDGGKPQRSAEVTVLIKYEWSTTTSTTTTTTTTTPSVPTPPPSTTSVAESDNVFDNAGFVALFVVLMAILVIGLIALLYYLIRYRGLCGIEPLSSKTTAVQNVNAQQSSKKLSHESIYSDAREDNQVRTNKQYRDVYWKNEDNFETGAGHSMSPALTLGSQRLALPPPPSRPRQAFVF
ncbi:hypothetical protein Btru_063309 [Bulinus truncatus]|nr:hypothetical protein Btru_063309 [Bulinus truncatus]